MRTRFILFAAIALLLNVKNTVSANPANGKTHEVSLSFLGLNGTITVPEVVNPVPDPLKQKLSDGRSFIIEIDDNNTQTLKALETNDKNTYGGSEPAVVTPIGTDGYIIKSTKNGQASYHFCYLLKTNGRSFKFTDDRNRLYTNDTEIKAMCESLKTIKLK